jgi:D-alanyl-D-alanine carboxypeptidase
VLLGIVQAQVGTVPRALAPAGIDEADPMTRVRQTLTNEGE